MPRYQVIGTGIHTGRQRKRIFEAKNEEELHALLKKDQTTAETVEELPPLPPSENQLQYANSLGINIPEGVSFDELSDLISFKQMHDKKASERHRGFAEYFGIETTKYTGKKLIYERIFNTLLSEGRDQELAAWFVFRVYRNLVKGADDAMIEGPQSSKIQHIADLLKDDIRVMNSIRRYDSRYSHWFGTWTDPDGFSHEGGSKGTVAFKAAREQLQYLIKEEDAIKKHVAQRLKASTQKTEIDKNKKIEEQDVVIGLIFIVILFIIMKIFT
ncbi:MAG: hypothetical protein P794_00805 [Epsilonproteobacteria bacterium (ex Lamellibrachia satsuma)]|nr:MAG: hypothetical protein P794_00805 [Epsilonproteobacteria bacterium (ex Lamellibrachia satsuma)]